MYTEDELRTKIKDEREKIVSLFPQPIHIKEIENEYWPKGFQEASFPWFLITTVLGPIKIGWRKRVISINWEYSDITITAEKLFPEEDTTKYEQLIHAWGYEKAKQYIDKLLTQQP